MVFEDGAFGRLSGHESGDLMNGINVLIKKTPQRAPLRLLCEDTVKMTIYEPGNGLSLNLLAP